METLAIINSLKHFRVYLIGIKFTIVTDCNAIKATVNKREILPRVARWWTYLQDFNYEIVYRKGSSLSHVDFFSRNPVSVLHVSQHEPWLHIQQKGDAEVQQMISDLREGKLDPKQYVEKDGLLFHQNIAPNKSKTMRFFVPRQSRLGLLRLFHDEQCHIGTDKTIASIMQHFWFPRLRRFVQNYVKHCLVCAVKKTRTGPLQGFVRVPEKPSTPFHIVHVDCLGPLPVSSQKFKYVLVMIDAFTKYCHLTPLKSVTAAETQQAFQTFIGSFGTPRVIVSDSGTNFHNLSLCRFLDELCIEYHFITPDVHRANGQVERYMRTLMNLIRIETRVRSEWPNVLWKIQLVLNTTVQKSTNTTPMRALMGLETTTPLIQAVVNNLGQDVTPVRNLQVDRERVRERLQTQSHEEIAALNTKRRDQVRYSVGDFVLLHRSSKMHASKTDFEYMGPYEIVHITNEGRYELKRVGARKHKIVKAAKEQLRLWPSEWSIAANMGEILDLIDTE